MERARWGGSAPAKKDHVVRNPACKFNPIASTCQKLPCLNAQPKSSKCFIKITGSRYNGTFLLNVDDGLDDTIYHTMREIEVALENQVDPLGKPRVSPKNCLSSVFKCFGTSELNEKLICNKKKKKKGTTPVESLLKDTTDQSNIGPLMTTVHAKSFNPIPENSNETVMRNVVDVFQTTLDQFRTENMNASEVIPSTLHERSQTQFPAKIKQNEIGLTKPSSEEAKKVSFIRFSQEEVVVIQPPKPSNDPQELEVGIEVKPKTTAVNVGQSIKLAEDKVLIGVQDGRGVLHISEGIPKRTLQMVLEEDINGKPSMKLCLNEETLDQKANSLQKNFAEIKFRDIPDRSSSSNNNYGDRDGNSFNFQNSYRKLGTYKSVESQVSWAHLRNANQASENIAQYKTESTQCDYNPMATSTNNHCLSTGKTKPQTSDANVGNDTDESKVTCIEKPLFKEDSEVPECTHFREDRLPYLVHTLHEPRSLNYSSCFVSDEPSTYFSNSKVMRSTQTYKKQLKTEKVKPRKPIEFSSDRSSSSKCTKIFRNIGEISAKSSRPLGWKDAGMTTNAMEDFETVLQNMCGSSYLYHNPEHSLQKPAQCGTIVNTKKPKSFPLSFDQWTQTDHHHCIQTGPEHIEKCHKETETIVEPNYDCFPRDIIREGKRTKSCASQSVDGSSIIVSSTEEEISDSSDGAKPTLQCSMIESPGEKALKNKERGYLINGKAKSFVGQTIFAAIEERTIDPDLFGLVKKADSFIYPACRDKSDLGLQGGGNISVVNMALFENPIEQPLPECIEKDEEVIPECFLATQVDKWDQSKASCVADDRLSSISSIRIKSKSCQDLSTAPSAVDVNRGGPKRIPCTSRQRMKLRYPQITVTDSHRGSAVNVCGVLNFSEEKIAAEHPVDNIISSKKDCSLPPAIRQLLLPRQRSAELGDFHEPTYYCNDLNPPEYWNHKTFNQIQNELFVFNETAESVTSLVLRKSLFKKTCFAMKTARVAVGKTFYSILRKLSFSDAIKKKRNKVINDSLVYVAIPLEKKSENIRLCTKLQ